MKFLAPILLASFIGIAVFGAFGMRALAHDHSDGCIAATVQGAACPKKESSFSYLAFHLDALRFFSSATPSEHLSISFALLLLSIVAIGIGAYRNSGGPLATEFAHDYGHRELVIPRSKQALTRWLSLHENSPSLA